MRRAGNRVGSAPDDPRGVCHTGLFESGGRDNGDGTCTYPSGPTCAYGDMPNKDRTACVVDRCTKSRRLMKGAIAAGAGALAGYGVARALSSTHTLSGALKGGALAIGAYAFYDMKICLLGDSGT